MEDDEEEKELSDLQNVFDEIFKAPATQKEKIEFKIMLGFFDEEGCLPETKGIKKLIQMKAKHAYKR